MADIYFVCKNKNCQPGRWGGDIIEIPEKHEEHISCPSCNQKYFIAEDKSVLTKFDGKPLLIDSFNTLNSFIESYTNNRLYIETLHLKGISDNENFDKTFAYNSCFIQNLIIEDLDLKTTCSPITFNKCYIDKITILNTRIAEDSKKDFWGPYSFYGITFNETEVFQQMEVENFDGELLIKACDFSEPIKISNSNIHKINLVNNKNEPVVEAHNSKIKEKLHLPVQDENGVKAGPPPAKKATDHLIKDEGNGTIQLNNKHIGNLTFETKEEFGSAVKITNCVIGNLQFPEQVFAQNIEFHNCIFHNPVLISKSNFQKVLCFEASYFEQDFSLNEVMVNADLHLSYSTFARNLNLNHSVLSGYFNMHNALVGGAFNLERCAVVQNLTLVGSGFDKMIFKTTEFRHEAFFNSCTVNGLFVAKFLTVSGDFDFNKSTLNSDVDISSSKINGDVRLTDCHLSENLNLTLDEVKGDVVFAQSTFIGKIDFLLSKISSLWLYSNCLVNNLMNNQGSIEKTTQVINNVVYQQFILYQLTLTDSKFNNNYFVDTLDLDTVDCDDIEMQTNWIENLRMENVVCGKIISDGGVFETINISEIVCNKKFILKGSSFYGKTEINQSKFVRLVEFSNCVFEDSVYFDNNNLGSSLLFKNNNFKGKGEIRADLSITDNKISNSLQIEQVNLDGKTVIQKNNIGQEFLIGYSKINPDEANEQDFLLRSIEKGLWIEQNNVVHNVQLKYLICEAPLYFERNLVTGSLKIGGSKLETQFNRSVSVSNNRVRAIETIDCQFNGNACLFNNHVEGGLIFGNSNFNLCCDASGTYVGGSALFANTYFKSELVLDNTFFDKRLDFKNCYPDKVSIKGSTLQGFNMPSNWRMKNGRLCSVDSNKEPVLIDERMLFGKDRNVPFTYNLTCDVLLDDPAKMNTLKQNWRTIKSAYQQEEEKEEEEENELPDELKVLFYYEPLIDQVLKDEFFPLYYHFIEKFEIEEITGTTRELVNKLEKGAVGSREIESLKEFCIVFDQLLTAFNQVNGDGDSQIAATHIKPLLYERLQDQYLVVKEIYGGNGELGDEDRSYFRWMHYKNLLDFRLSKWYQKPAKMFKWLVFENIFGWGVDLFRIFGSTILLVLVFSGIYWIGGQISPAMSIRWDDADIPISMLNYGNILLLTFQTTFAAFMGDWSPAGLGSMKIWMTINAVLGVLLVAFLIGAYGRKMLR